MTGKQHGKISMESLISLHWEVAVLQADIGLLAVLVCKENSYMLIVKSWFPMIEKQELLSTTKWASCAH